MKSYLLIIPFLVLTLGIFSSADAKHHKNSHKSSNKCSGDSCSHKHKHKHHHHHHHRHYGGWDGYYGGPGCYGPGYYYGPYGPGSAFYGPPYYCNDPFYNPYYGGYPCRGGSVGFQLNFY